MRGVARAVFHGLADSRRLKALASRYRLGEQAFARRFVAGETASDAVAAAHRLAAPGITHTLEYLGARATSAAQADAFTRAYLGLLREIAGTGLDRHVSVALPHFGLQVDRATCVDNLRRVLDLASAQDFLVQIGMEGPAWTQAAIDVFETLWQQAYRTAGITLQAALPRTREDARRLSRLGARIRLVKIAPTGARSGAYRAARQVDAAYVEIMQQLLIEGVSPAFATHDPAIVHAARSFAARRGIPPDRFEFQMHYGIREDLQAALAADGCRVRVSIPFGPEWFRCVMERLGERPGAIRSALRRLSGERQRTRPREV